MGPGLPAPPLVPADVRRRPAYLIKRISDDVRACMEESLRPLGLTVPQYACMYHLHESPGISGAELARRAFVTRQAIYLVLEDLRERGWVTREARGNGVRQGAAHLTRKGRSVIENAFAPVDRIEAALVEDLSGQEREQLASLLTRCDIAISRLADADS